MIVLLHGGAAINLLRGSDLARGGTVQVAPAPPVPARVRVVGKGGIPMAGATLALSFGRIVLGPEDFLTAYSLSAGPLLIGPADSQGLIELRGVDLSAGTAPAIVVAGEARARPRSLATLKPGATLEIEIP